MTEAVHGGALAGRREAFYGWYVVGAATVIAFVAWGVAFWNIGVFLYAFHETYGWSRAALSGSATLFSLVAGLTGLAAGRVVDRHGPRFVLIFGGVVTGLGMLSLGQARELWQVYLCHAILATGYGCIHVLVLSALVARWFRRRRAWAMTLALTGSSVGGLVLVPLSTALIARFDIATAATTLAVVTWALVLPAAVFVVRDRPEHVGQRPDGDSEPSQAGPVLLADRLWTAGEAVQTGVWWTIILAFTLTLLGQSSYLIHQVSFLSPKLGLSGAAFAVAITTATGVVGRFALGALGGRLSSRRLAMGCMVLQIVSALGAVSSDRPPVLYLTAGAIGATMGLVIALHPLMMVERFGVRSHGTVYGPAFLSTQLGQAVGPLLVGALADLTGGYGVPFTVTASAGVVAAGLLWLTPSALPVQTRPTPAAARRA